MSRVNSGPVFVLKDCLPIGGDGTFNNPSSFLISALIFTFRIFKVTGMIVESGTVFFNQKNWIQIFHPKYRNQNLDGFPTEFLVCVEIVNPCRLNPELAPQLHKKHTKGVLKAIIISV